MILPTKRLPEDRAMLAVGAEILSMLSQPKTVSKVWAEMKQRRAARDSSAPVPFDWFVLTLSYLFVIHAIDFEEGRLRKAPR